MTSRLADALSALGIPRLYPRLRRAYIFFAGRRRTGIPAPNAGMESGLAEKTSYRMMTSFPGSYPLGLYLGSRPVNGFRRLNRRAKLLTLLLLFFTFSLWIFLSSSGVASWRNRMNGSDKFVIILGANIGGGVMEWKGAREWAIERDSIRNKRRYAARWGYHLDIIDRATKRKYSHEWRESWEKADLIRDAFKKFPNAEWFWWVDLNTIIMEPSYSLQNHLFGRLGDITYRDINHYNPLNITHPFTDPWLDPLSRSAVGDGRPESIFMLLSQDCSGFNLGSFFVRRSEWADRLLDIWWDPVTYEQKHMEWEHKEQDAFETLYQAQPWIRQHTAFVEQRMINSFPRDACREKGFDPRIHYDKRGRDFLVNMAGCEWGRDCWSEMYRYRELSYYLNRNPWERFKEDFVAVAWEKVTGRKIKL